MKSYVNLGCGHRFHPDWTNIDIAPRDARVIQHDLSRGIPLDANSCDVVYQSASFEHFRRGDALKFLHECHRVLRPGGIIRVGAPDLEKMCRLYLEKLEAAALGDAKAAADYDWMVLELVDQSVREASGGDMLAYLRGRIPNEGFVRERVGEEARELIAMARTNGGSPSVGRRAKAALRRLQRGLLTVVLGSEGVRAWEIGRFRLAGEVHHWMYDRYSLSRLLIEAGFSDPVLQPAACSRIPNWPAFHLDTLDDGTPVKPDLFFMEAVKSSSAREGLLK